MVETTGVVGETFVAATAVSEEQLLRDRKEKIVKFFTKNYSWLTFVVLAIILYLTVKIRTSNLWGLKDITTGGWALGPDLDPYLFLRWAKYIVANGHLMTIDMMRYLPLGYNTKGELILHPYMIAWFHQFLSLFGWTQSIEYSAVVYPVFFWVLTVIAFFFMTRKIFADEVGIKNSNYIALIASFFLSVMPPILPRTIAGIPEKESVGFFFIFLTFYLFISAWKTKKSWARYTLAILAGVATAAMALSWGGVTYIFLTLGPSIFVAFLLDKVGRKEIVIYSLWLITSFVLMYPFSTRYGLKDLFTSIDTGSAAIVLFLMILHVVLFETALKEKLKLERFKKIKPQLFSFIVAVGCILIVATLFFGLNFFTTRISNIVATLVSPSTNRLGLTVAENKQPYFTGWAGNFGPYVQNIPLMFWLFFIGSIYWVYEAMGSIKKIDRWGITGAYILFLIGIIFSRYSPNSTLNGTNGASLFVYACGFIVLVGSLGYYYHRYYTMKEDDVLQKINIGFLIAFTFFFLGIISARGAERTVMVLVPSISLIVGFLFVSVFTRVKQMSNGKKIIGWFVVGIIGVSLIFSGYTFYQESYNEGRNYIPGMYNQQWQKAMSWVRTSTPQNAVFGHWWDYGYWVQSIGERATVLDGGNAIAFWDYEMGRYALTGTNDTEDIQFLYAHNTTHFLIDSSDIGKYSAFSSIGSDSTYDRASYIPSFQRDPKQVQEKKNSTILFYSGGASLDEDIVYDMNGTKTFLPHGAAGLGAVLIEFDSSGNMVAQPQGIFVYQGTQYTLPFRYAFYKKKLIDFNSGIESGVFIYPSASQSSAGLQIDFIGSLFYLSKRTVKSQVARLYLYEEDNPYFKLAHSEDDFFVAQIKSQNPSFNSDFLDYGGLHGPIRIWEIHYPKDVVFDKKYVSTYYPPELNKV